MIVSASADMRTLALPGPGADTLVLNDQLFTFKLELKDDSLSNIELAEEDVGYGEQRDGTY